MCHSYSSSSSAGHAEDSVNKLDHFMIRRLVSSIDARYPTRPDKEARWLIGFSKSGWGAYTLLLRNKETFGYASAWDTPFMLNGDNNGKGWAPLGLSENYGTIEAMKPNVPTKLAVENAALLKQWNRLVLGVGIDWGDQCKQMHQLLETNAIPHIYRPDLLVKHEWESGWFAPMAKELVKLARMPWESNPDIENIGIPPCAFLSSEAASKLSSVGRLMSHRQTASSSLLGAIGYGWYLSSRLSKAGRVPSKMSTIF